MSELDPKYLDPAHNDFIQVHDVDDAASEGDGRAPFATLEELTAPAPTPKADTRGGGVAPDPVALTIALREQGQEVLRVGSLFLQKMSDGIFRDERGRSLAELDPDDLERIAAGIQWR
ncbi:MAG: hypothetical protein JW793_10470 [Acidobacteria bacterium]|nr:hypothetical protein [Acidobacteriota bacterium]